MDTVKKTKKHSGGVSENKQIPVRLAQGLIHLGLALFCLSIIAPMLLTVIVSFSSELSVLQKGYTFFPSEWSLEAYRFVFSTNDILTAYWVTIRVTVVGTVLSVLITSLTGYVLSRQNVKYRMAIAFYFYIPTIISAGLVAWYYTIKEVLHLQNTFWVLVLPNVVNVYNIFMTRNYYKGIPASLEESARIDGAGAFRVFWQIMFPLALPITATIGLFVCLGYWNDWFLASWFIDLSRTDLQPLQFYLYNLWQKMSAMTPAQGVSNAPTETVYVATMFVVMGPIVLVYPFVQRFFIKGITVGAVKG